MAWSFNGYGRYTNGNREVHEISPGLYQARLRRSHLGQSDLVDGTIYGLPSLAKAAADRLAQNEAKTRGYSAPAHDPDPVEPITEAAEIMANRGLFADSGGAYED